MPGTPAAPARPATAEAMSEPGPAPAPAPRPPPESEPGSNALDRLRSAEVTSLGMTQNVFPSPWASCGSVCRYW